MKASRNGHSPVEDDYWGQENYHTIYGPIGIVIDHEKPACPVIVVRLTRVFGGGRGWVREITKPPRRRQIHAARKGLLSAGRQVVKEASG
jgi:hypothetical protein